MAPKSDEPRFWDSFLEVVRIFDDENIIHVSNKVEPLSDIETINLELILADLQTVSKRLTGLSSEIKKGSKSAIVENEGLTKIKITLENGKLSSTVVLDEKESVEIKKLGLLTMKPILYVLNKKAGGKNLDELKDERYTKLLNFFKETSSKYVVVDAGIENELKELEGSDKKEMREGLGVKEDGIDDLIKAGYDLLGLITYFTTGEDETRAWTIKKGWTAPEAGTAIHGDFKEKFVRAEIIEWDKLLEAGSYGNAREKGLLRTEGKEYIVKDGDVVEFKI